MAQFVAKSLIAHGKVERGWLGVTIRALTPELARSFKTQGQTGALIVDVTKGGPAEKAGIKKNDIVLSYQGKEMTGANEFRNAVAETAIGTEARLTVLRDGKKEVLSVKIGSLEEATRLLSSVVSERLGIEVRPPNNLEAGKYGLNQNQGVVIVAIEASSPLKEAGFEKGDMILAVDNQPVQNREAFVDIVSLLKANQKITLLALDHRTGNTGTVQVTVR
jgi:serine protease Do